MLELTQPDTGRITITAKPDRFQSVVGKHGTQRQGRHTPVQPIKAKRTTQKISWAIAGATNPAEFHDFLRNQVHFITRRYDLSGNSIMPATLAQCGRCTTVIIA